MTALAVFDEASKRYGDRTVVDRLSFEVQEGSITGLLGPNGAGKTTAIRLLLGIASVTEGSCSLFGASPGRRGFRDAVRRCGALIESPSLYGNASALTNLQIWAVARGMSRRDPRIGRTLERVGLAGRGGDRAKDFSLGMRQRLGIAMAILHEPRMVILDEPTNGLDPAGTVEIRELIRSLPARGTTVLVSSHVLAEVQKTVDRVVIVAAGRLRAAGAIEDFVEGGDADHELVLLPADRSRGIALLERSGLDVTERDGAVGVEGGVSGSELVRMLADAAIYPEEVRRHDRTLEDAFLQIVRESDTAVSE